MTNIKQKVEEGWIYCRVVVEMLGKPVEHVDGAIRKVLDKIKEEKDFVVIKGKLAKPKKIETGAKEADRSRMINVKHDIYLNLLFIFIVISLFI